MLAEIERIATEAGEKIMAIYGGNQGVTYKEDDSPLTLADKAAHDHIVSELSRLFPEIPVISEEGSIPDAETRAGMARFFLVDPLDGTKELIKRNGEFTVNIALIEGDEVVLGVVVTPVNGHVYSAEKGEGATLLVSGDTRWWLRCNGSLNLDRLRVSSSRSHPSGDLAEFLDSFPELVRRPLGSSLKFLKLAENEVDFYPRFGVINEWDTAAAHHILEEAGGVVTDLKGNPLRYNKPVMKHFGFLATRFQKVSDYLLPRIPDIEIVDDRA